MDFYYTLYTPYSMNSKCFPIEMLRLCSISTSQMDTENTEHMWVKIQFQLQCIITIPLWRIERYKIAPVSQIPDPVPTGQLAEGAAKNLLLPRERGRGCHPPRARGMLPSRERGEGSVLQERGGMLEAITGRKIPFPT